MPSRRRKKRKKQRKTGVDSGTPKTPWNTETPTRAEDNEESIPREAQRVCEEECREKDEDIDDLQQDIQRWWEAYGLSQCIIHDALPRLYNKRRTRGEIFTLTKIRIGNTLSGLYEKRLERVGRIEERERVEKIRKVEKAREFKRLRAFMGIRVRICRLKRVSRRQRYESAQTTIEGDLGRYSSERKKQWEAAEQEFRPRRQLEDRDRHQRQAVRRNTQRLLRKWKKAIEKGAKYGGDSEESCKELARRYVRGIEGIPQRNRVKRVNRMWVEFQSSYAYQIRRAKVREAYVAERRQGIIRAMKTNDKTRIAQQVRASIEAESLQNSSTLRMEGDYKESRLWRVMDRTERRRRQQIRRGHHRKRRRSMGEGCRDKMKEDAIRRYQKKARWWEFPVPGPPESVKRTGQEEMK